MTVVPIGTVRVWVAVLGFAMGALGLDASAQLVNQPSSSTQSSRVLDMPMPNSLDKDSRVFSPARIFGNTGDGKVGLDLKERPAPAAPKLNLFTTLETKVENKTVNHVGGVGGPAVAEPAHVPSAGVSSVVGLEFSDWVRQSVGQSLPVFGSDLMGETSLGSAIDPLTVPVDYRVGPGDELLIRAWGQIDIDFQGAIDRSGQIFLPRVGPVTVAGMRVGELNELIKTHVQRQFRNFELTVTLGQLRQIQYYVMGFAKKPGVHATSSTATVLYGLMAAGGAQVQGDLRRIELRRAGVTVATVDAYRFLVDGDRSQDPQLLPGDVVFVPPAHGFAALAGGVKRPAIYQLSANSTVDELLRSAGGWSLNRDHAALRIERMEGGRRVSESVLYSAAVGQRPLRDGELIMVLPASPKIERTVTLRGHVAAPLRQGWREGMRVSDLFSSRDDLVRMAAWVQRNERESLAKVADARRDNEFRREFPDMEWDYAAIERIDPGELKSVVKTFSLRKALAGDAQENHALLPGDVVVVFAQTDFKQPQSKRLKMVRVEGEVRVPGIYPVGEGETLEQVLDRAGGLTSRAYLFGTVFTRQSARQQEQERLRQATDRVEQDYLRFLAARARQAVSQEETMVGHTELEAIRALVSRLRAMQAQGRIPLNLPGRLTERSALPYVVLEDEDSILVPHQPSTVTVVGAVYQEGSHLWNSGWRTHDYLQSAGGMRTHADASRVMVLRADGTVRLSNGWWTGNLDIHPGDTIVVPEDVRSLGWTKVFKDWSQIFYQLGLGTAALKVLRSGL